MLTPQQKLFCKYYTTKGELFSNATLCYNLAYGYNLEDLSQVNAKDEKGFDIIGSSDYSKAYRTCSTSGSRLLINDEIQKEINDNLVALLNDNTIDARLTEILQNGKDTDSVQAIKIANDLRNRITKHIDLTTANRPLGSLSDDALKALAD